MVDSRCHSFEDVSSAHHHRMSLTSLSQYESPQDSGPVILTEFATINLPLLDSPTSSQISLTLKPKASAANVTTRLKENRSVDSPPPEQSRSRVRGNFNRQLTHGTFTGLISPDRFIPKREFTETPSTPYRINKYAYQLSPREKVVRRRLLGDDPFLSSTRRPSALHGQRPASARPRQRPYQQPHLVTDSTIMGANSRNDFIRQVSARAVWGVGGTSAALGDSSTVAPVPNETRSVSSRGSSAPRFVAKFLPINTRADDQNKHESRLALALDIDPTTRLLGTCMRCEENAPSPASPDYERLSPFVWKDSTWKKVEMEYYDFYCSTLAYSLAAGVLAVGLAQYVYLWSESFAVDHPPFGDVHPSNFVTSLSFSSENGSRSILAVGRQSGQLSLWSVFETKVRFEVSHPNSISCVSFKPKVSQRPSERYSNLMVEVEDLAVGDEMGNIWYYSVEWPEIHNKWSWTGSMTLLAKISAHSQQICGLAWSPDERFLATGGNDNVCLLFELPEIIPSPALPPSLVSALSGDSLRNMNVRTFPSLNLGTTPQQLLGRQHIVSHLLPSWVHPPPIKPSMAVPLMSHAGTLISGTGKTVLVPSNRQKHRLAHAAAVKAIAFAPWQPSLLATGGGSNDRAIHFYHTRTGVCLATINVFAQVTSLIWSQTRREIAATFGYAQPDHPFRIAVFAWPSCTQVAVIPWGPYGTSWDELGPEPSYDCGRALWAISYPGKSPALSSIELEGPNILTPPSSPPSRSTSPSPLSSQVSGQGNASTMRRRGPREVRPKEKEGGMWCTRTMEEGCIIVASSDQTVKFHEVWTGRRKSIGIGSAASGLLGGSDILESMEGIEKPGGEIIR
ncbi:hypothetical protein N7462_011670 [Penicillium macrosclerotiorum]|uniref:uncharacterized protein n=1 Tax=Penicillium macrosclerotiorum TaxID=303699 RepID=UPI002546FB4D|nr:uncharacterized protein N7462_011670 [Penicillium macrosclerotiorum]KAJ5662744.1 hypothetical protein N7462_011670 [Penicillium macrosclerotiorum]